LDRIRRLLHDVGYWSHNRLLACKENLMPTPTYDPAFFEMVRRDSRQSAQLVVPKILELFQPTSLLDVGCGTGEWLDEFSKQGVTNYLGIDGDYVDSGQLSIPKDRYKPVDLRQPFDVGRFDMVCSFEVGEHLSDACSDGFVASLTAAAPVVIFSAAIPYQGGVDHINERWQSYWGRKFQDRGYIAFDPLRPAIKHNKEIGVWYRQNTLVYCIPSSAPKTLQPCAIEDLDFVHPELHEMIMENVRNAIPNGTKSVQGLLNVAKRRIGIRRAN
jgi:SAM-dependent methyltransferase